MPGLRAVVLIALGGNEIEEKPNRSGAATLIVEPQAVNISILVPCLERDSIGQQDPYFVSS